MIHTETSTNLREKDPLATALNAIPLATLFVDKTLKIRWINKMGEALFGRQRESLIGQSIDRIQGDLLAGSNGLSLGETIRTLFRGGDPICEVAQQVTILSDGKKTDRHVKINASPAQFDGDQMILMALQDTTPPREPEGEKGAETEVLSHTIQMVRAKAHELNQPLSVLVASLELLNRNLEADSALKNRMDRISKSADRVTELVRQLQLIIHSPRRCDTLKADKLDSEKTPMIA